MSKAIRSLLHDAKPPKHIRPAASCDRRRLLVRKPTVGPRSCSLRYTSADILLLRAAASWRLRIERYGAFRWCDFVPCFAALGLTRSTRLQQPLAELRMAVASQAAHSPY